MGEQRGLGFPAMQGPRRDKKHTARGECRCCKREPRGEIRDRVVRHELKLYMIHERKIKISYNKRENDPKKEDLQLLIRARECKRVLLMSFCIIFH